MFGCLIEYLIASYFGSMIFYFLIFIDTLFYGFVRKMLWEKTYFTGGIDPLDANYASPLVIEFKCCF